MMIFALLSTMLLLMILASGTAESIVETDLTMAHTSANQALNRIKEAENSGADVSVLIQRFNYALDFLRQAETSNFRSCPTYETCIKNALDTFNSINNDSRILQEETSRESGYENALVLGIYIPLTAFFTLLFIFHIYRLWKLSNEKKFLNKQIRKDKGK